MGSASVAPRPARCPSSGEFRWLPVGRLVDCVGTIAGEAQTDKEKKVYCRYPAGESRKEPSSERKWRTSEQERQGKTSAPPHLGDPAGSCNGSSKTHCRTAEVITSGARFEVLFLLLRNFCT